MPELAESHAPLQDVSGCGDPPSLEQSLVTLEEVGEETSDEET